MVEGTARKISTVAARLMVHMFDCAVVLHAALACGIGIGMLCGLHSMLHVERPELCIL